MVPPFTLFGFIASQPSDAFRANNVKSGTGVAEAAERVPDYVTKREARAAYSLYPAQ